MVCCQRTPSAGSVSPTLLSAVVALTRSRSSMSSPCFPPTVGITWHPAFLHRVLAGRVPRLQQYYQDATTSCRPSRRTSLPSLGVTTGVFGRFVSPAAAEHSATGLELVTRYLQPGLLPRRRQDLLRSWGTLLCSCPALRPRQDRRVRPSQHVDTVPAMTTAKTPTTVTFEAQSHSFGTGCLRFAGRVTPTPRKTRFRLPTRLYRTGLTTRKVPTKGLKLTSCQLSSFPKLS